MCAGVVTGARCQDGVTIVCLTGAKVRCFFLTTKKKTLSKLKSLLCAILEENLGTCKKKGRNFSFPPHFQVAPAGGRATFVLKANESLALIRPR